MVAQIYKRAQRNQAYLNLRLSLLKSCASWCLFFLVWVPFLNGCCTKKDCDQETFPQVKLYFRDVADGNPNHTLAVVRLQPGTGKAIDSYSIRNIYNLIDINIWYQYRRDGWQNYNYAFHLEVPGTEDTISDIRYDIQVDKVTCNTCFPFGDGRADITTYKNFGMQHKGKTIRDGDTVFIDR